MKDNSDIKTIKAKEGLKIGDSDGLVDEPCRLAKEWLAGNVKFDTMKQVSVFMTAIAKESIRQHDNHFPMPPEQCHHGQCIDGCGICSLDEMTARGRIIKGAIKDDHG